MKVVFANAPVIRSKSSCPENNFRIDGFIFKPQYKKIPGLWKTLRFLNRTVNLGGTVRYGVRAGSRWPWTTSFPPGTPHFPFFLAYAAAYLKAHGIDVSILDAVANEEYSYSTFIKKVEKEHADIVVIECSTPTIDIDLWVAKQISCFTEVALAGPHLAYKAAEVQKDHPYIKYLLKSEYILSTYEVVQNRRAGIYEGTVVEDLDSIPVPLRDFEGGEKYYDPSMPTRRPQLPNIRQQGLSVQMHFLYVAANYV